MEAPTILRFSFTKLRLGLHTCEGNMEHMEPAAKKLAKQAVTGGAVVMCGANLTLAYSGKTLFSDIESVVFVDLESTFEDSSVFHDDSWCQPCGFDGVCQSCSVWISL